MWTGMAKHTKDRTLVPVPFHTRTRVPAGARIPVTFLRKMTIVDNKSAKEYLEHGGNTNLVRAR